MSTTTAEPVTVAQPVHELDEVNLRVRIAILRTAVRMGDDSRATADELGRAILRLHELTRPVPYTLVALGVVRED